MCLPVCSLSVWFVSGPRVLVLWCSCFLFRLLDTFGGREVEVEVAILTSALWAAAAVVVEEEVVYVVVCVLLFLVVVVVVGGRWEEGR